MTLMLFLRPRDTFRRCDSRPTVHCTLPL